MSVTDLCPTCGGDCGTSECENTCSAHGLASCQACPPQYPPRACGCPEQDGAIYHQRETCTDPLVARLDWYGTPPAAKAGAAQEAGDCCLLCGAGLNRDGSCGKSCAGVGDG